MRSEDLSHARAVEMNRAASAAHLDAVEVTIELAVSADGEQASTLRGDDDTTPYVDIELTPRRVDHLEPPRRLLPEGWDLSFNNHQDGSVPALGIEGAS